MRYLGPATFDDVVAAFLHAEADSPRFSQALWAVARLLLVREELITSPDTTNASDNSMRLAVFQAYRGVPPMSGLFEGFPEEVSWTWEALSPAELENVLYINWDWWLETSAGTRRPKQALARLRQDEGLADLANQIGEGQMPVSVVIVGDPACSKLVVLEGHRRLTAMVLASERLPAEISVLLGISTAIADWPLY